jgi:phosphatidylserine/phosphatidylglycerophosphate/cardiolipin synthase-like enzyme
MAGDPILDPLVDRLPKVLLDRVVVLQPNKLNTVRLMHDFQDNAVARWYDSSQTTPRMTTGNEVVYLIEGQETFPAMINAIQTATDPQKHFIYLLGWWLEGFPMNPGGSSNPTIFDLLTAAAMNNIQVRAMLWDQRSTIKPRLLPHSENLGWQGVHSNEPEVAIINGLPNNQGAAILDNRTLPMGAHHQKILIVNGTDGLLCFCGGLDINPDRLYPKGVNGSASLGAPYHDVSSRSRGPAADDILKIFTERWDDHPDRQDLEAALPTGKGKEPLRAVTAPPQPSPNRGSIFVKVGRTYGNATKQGFASIVSANSVLLSTGGSYKFATFGEHTVADMILFAISQAKRFIYIEDQYLVNLEAQAALLAALRNIQHLTILIPHPSISDLPQVHFRQQQFISLLRARDNRKVQVFCPSPFLGSVVTTGPMSGTVSFPDHSYVHNKMWIIDDQFAIIGSPNINRRGWTNDSEACVGISDGSRLDQAAFFFAHRLRIRRWAALLGMDTPAGFAELTDGVASSVHWLNKPPISHVEPIDENANIESLHTDTFWDTFADPDGR